MLYSPKSLAAVYPRGCGELIHKQNQPTSVGGLSPWVRGTHNNDGAVDTPPRFIPVGAGNSLSIAPLRLLWPVYPRGCGELACNLWPDCCPIGLSPWVRGTRYPFINNPTEKRFIPVGAGNSLRGCDGIHSNSVYPRGCGELPIAVVYHAANAGLSPWVRGTLYSLPADAAISRFIPVGAGNSPLEVERQPPDSVYPRGCGELWARTAKPASPRGLSPWVRGTQPLLLLPPAVHRFIPVGAGNSFSAVWFSLL